MVQDLAWPRHTIKFIQICYFGKEWGEGVGFKWEGVRGVGLR